MHIKLLDIYRQLPWFKGKLRLGKLLFREALKKQEWVGFTAHYGLKYDIPNTKENIGIELLINGIYEKEVVDFLNKHIKNGAIYFDVGANIGSIGLPIIKTKKLVRYVAFEASPKVFGYLKKNIEQNDVHDFHIQNNLVHNNSNEKMLFYEADLYGKSSLSPTYTNQSIEVTSISLDQFALDQAIEKIDWLKVDVQGFEWFVFDGAKQLMTAKKIENILFENEPWAEDQANIQRGLAKELVVSMGYELLDLQGNPWIDTGSEKETMIWARIKR